jgi:hypothetical protein
MMRHSHLSHDYPASHYDDQLCLKPPLLLWVAIFYLSRTVTLPIAMAMSHFAGVDPSAIAVMRGLWTVNGLVPSLIAVALLYAVCRRAPTASKPVRWIWANGRVVLAVSAILDAILLGIALIKQGEINDQALISMLAAAGDLYFLVYILVARRVRDAFAEFPPPLEPAGPVSPAEG